jgi:hypothetical protein
MPIVIAIALFSWVAAVLRADTHPQYKHHSRLPRYEVTGGAFQANDGGRQLMPIPGGRPMSDRPGNAATAGIPAQRTATSAEEGRPTTAEQGAAEEQHHLVAGSKLRLGRLIPSAHGPATPC